MKRPQAEKLVRELLRKTALRDSPRRVVFTEPVGRGGLGIDSLALVDFVLAYEKETGVVVDDAVWNRMASITPAYFVELLLDGDGR